jgi:omega-3 fatty acid desaturase (delta-15 desaturase)
VTHNLVLDPIAPADPSKRTKDLPFTLQDVREAIPAHCFKSSTWRSMAYAIGDILIVAGLFALAAYVDSWWFYPIFWVAQGTMFWALFVIGHDCGHRSFSPYMWLNNLVGHITHSFILVPFHGWRISHRTHHANTGNIDTDESWYPIPEAKYDEMGWPEKLVRFNLLLLAYPVYLFKRSPGRKGSHFLPSSDLFRESEKWDVITSTIWWSAMVTGLVIFGFQFGFVSLFKFYLVPYVIFVIWLDLVTYLHHTVEDMPWYRGKDWYFLKGALSTIDHDYGFINPIHHNIGTHVAHHIFLTIPHYHLIEATEAIKPVLGDFYRVSKQPIWKTFMNSVKTCHYIDNEGSGIYHKPAKKKA